MCREAGITLILVSIDMDGCDWLSYFISYIFQKRIIAYDMEMELNNVIILVLLWQVGHDTEKCY